VIPATTNLSSDRNHLSRLLVLTLLVGTVNGVSRVALPLYGVALGAQAWQIGIVGGFGYAGMLLLSMPVGAWIDRHGSRSLFVPGAAAGAFLYVILANATLPWQLVVITACMGLLLPLRMMPAHAEFLAMLPQLSPARAGWNRAASMSGMYLLGPALSAAMIAALGYPPVFVSTAAALVLVAVIGARIFKRHAFIGAARDESLVQALRGQFSLLREHGDLRRTMAVDFLTQAAVAYFTIFGLAVAVRRLAMPLQQAAGLVTVQGILYVLTLTAGGSFFLRRAQEHSYRVAFLFLGTQSILFAWAPHPLALWLGAAFLGIGGGIQGLLSTRKFAELVKRYGRGRIAGMTSLAAPAGGALGAVGGGLASQHLGPQLGFVVLAVAFAFAAARSLSQKHG
jgi:MFS family permease